MIFRVGNYGVDSLEVRWVGESYPDSARGTIAVLEVRKEGSEHWYGVLGLEQTEEGRLRLRRYTDVVDDPDLLDFFETEPKEHDSKHIRFRSNVIAVD